MYQCLKKLVKYKEYSCFDHSDILAHPMFTSDVCLGSLGTSIFENSSSAVNNTRSRLSFRLSPFLMTMLPLSYKFSCLVRSLCLLTAIKFRNVKMTYSHLALPSKHQNFDIFICDLKRFSNLLLVFPDIKKSEATVRRCSAK